MKLRVIVPVLMLLVAAATGLTARQAGPAQIAFEAARRMEVIDHDLPGAIAQYRELVSKYAPDRAVVPEALFRLAGCYEQLGQPLAGPTYERIVKEYPASARATAARARIDAIAQQGGLTTTNLAMDVGSPSPDGSYVTTVDRTGDLATLDLKSGKHRRLTTNKDNTWSEYAGDSVPSFDGTQIAYGWSRHDSSDLRIIKANGGSPRVLYHVEDPNTSVEPYSWSKDGKEILFSVSTGPRGAETKQILIVAESGGQPRVVTTINGGSARASWSPDGQYIVFDAPRGAGRIEHGLFITRTDGTSVAPLIAQAANEEVLDWFPDGKRLLFMSDRRGTNGVWSVGMVDGHAVGEPDLVMDNVGWIFGLGFTRDGTYYYRVLAVSDDVLVFRPDDSGALSGKVEPLQGRSAGKQGAAWSPDGSQIAYIPAVPFGVRMALSVCIQNMSDGQVRTIAVDLMSVANPAWMPDGQAILVEGKTSRGEQGVFRIALNTGAVSAVGEASTGPSAEKRSPAVSPDGRELFYSVGAGGIRARDLVSGAEHTVFSQPVYSFSLSPDGRFIAAMGFDSDRTPRYRIIPVAGGEPKDVSLAGVGLTWSADGRYLFATTGGPELLRIPIDGRPTERKSIAARGRTLMRVSVSPDGVLAISTRTWINEFKATRNFPAAKR